MELYEKSINTLELPAVLSMLAEEAVSDSAVAKKARTGTNPLIPARFLQAATIFMITVRTKRAARRAVMIFK